MYVLITSTFLAWHCIPYVILQRSPIRCKSFEVLQSKTVQINVSIQCPWSTFHGNVLAMLWITPVMSNHKFNTCLSELQCFDVTIDHIVHNRDMDKHSLGGILLKERYFFMGQVFGSPHSIFRYVIQKIDWEQSLFLTEYERVVNRFVYF